MRLLVLFFFICALCQAQNLVPNGSFETGTCSSFNGNIHEDCDSWYASIQDPALEVYENPSPDWWHTCAIAEGLRPPSTTLGYQHPYEGEGMAGIITYGPNDYYRELLAIEFTEPLEIGSPYLVNFMINKCAGIFGIYSSNNFGVKFTTFPYYFSPEEAIDNTSHFKIDSVVTDTLNWLLVQFEFVPDSSYQYMHLGNFYFNMETEVISGPMISSFAYYFIDDVSVSSTLSAESLSKPGFEIYPNPATSFVQIMTPNPDFRFGEIRDLTGKLLVSFDITGSNLNVDVSGLSAGIYLVRLEGTEGGVAVQKLMVE